MKNNMTRRDFMKAAPAATWVLANSAGNAPAQSSGFKIEPFNYQGVKLRESRWLQQYQSARAFYLGVSEDDILHGYRAAAGLPAPGKPLGGWCKENSSTVLGQWLSGMSRMYRAAGDAAMKEKAVRLMTEFAKTVKPDGACGLRHYTYEKLV